MGSITDSWTASLRRQGKIPFKELLYAEVQRDGLFVKAGDILAFIDAEEFGRWARSAADASRGPSLRELSYEDVQKKLGEDFVVVMSDSGAYDRHAMRFSDAAAMTFDNRQYLDDVGMFDLDVFGGAWYVTFYRHVYELNPSNFYTYIE